MRRCRLQQQRQNQRETGSIFTGKIDIDIFHKHQAEIIRNKNSSKKKQGVHFTKTITPLEYYNIYYLRTIRAKTAKNPVKIVFGKRNFRELVLFTEAVRIFIDFATPLTILGPFRARYEAAICLPITPLHGISSSHAVFRLKLEIKRAGVELGRN